MKSVYTFQRKFFGAPTKHTAIKTTTEKRGNMKSIKCSMILVRITRHHQEKHENFCYHWNQHNWNYVL